MASAVTVFRLHTAIQPHIIFYVYVGWHNLRSLSKTMNTAMIFI